MTELVNIYTALATTSWGAPNHRHGRSKQSEECLTARAHLNVEYVKRPVMKSPTHHSEPSLMKEVWLLKSHSGGQLNLERDPALTQLTMALNIPPRGAWLSVRIQVLLSSRVPIFVSSPLICINLKQDENNNAPLLCGYRKLWARFYSDYFNQFETGSLHNSLQVRHGPVVSCCQLFG